MELIHMIRATVGRVFRALRCRAFRVKDFRHQTSVGWGPDKASINYLTDTALLSPKTLNIVAELNPCRVITMKINHLKFLINYDFILCFCCK